MSFFWPFLRTYRSNIVRHQENESIIENSKNENLHSRKMKQDPIKNKNIRHNMGKERRKNWTQHIPKMNNYSRQPEVEIHREQDDQDDLKKIVWQLVMSIPKESNPIKIYYEWGVNEWMIICKIDYWWQEIEETKSMVIAKGLIRYKLSIDNKPIAKNLKYVVVDINNSKNLTNENQ